MPGIVYVLSNPAMPNLVKIGKTEKNDPNVRIGQLYSAGVPFPFECEIAVRVEDAAACEQALHDAFASQRVNPRREFFELDPEDIKPLLQLLGDEVAPGAAAAEEGEVDEASHNAADGYKRRRRPNINLQELGIPLGATLVLRKTGEEAAVRGPREVEFRGEEMSLTRAAKIGLDIDVAPATARQWEYEGRRLRDMHKELYE